MNSHETRHMLVPLDRDENGYPPYETEEVDVTPAGEGLWQVERSPVFAYGFAVGDVLSGEVSASGELWATAVVSSAGNWCARVLPVGGGDLASVVAAFEQSGCAARATRFGLVVVEPPTALTPAAVLELLQRGADESRWHFDLGVAPEDFAH